MIADPASVPLRFGQHRQLHEIEILDRAIHQAKSGGVDHVFGVMKHDEPEIPACTALLILKRRVKAVEAVRLRGGAIAIMNDDTNPRIAARAAHDRFQRGGVVAIAAGENAKVRLRPGGQGVGDREFDHLRLLPGRDEHCSGPCQLAIAQLTPVDPPAFDPAGQAQPRPTEIDGQFVDRPKQEENAGEQEQLVFHECKPLERYLKIQRTVPPTGPHDPSAYEQIHGPIRDKPRSGKDNVR